MNYITVVQARLEGAAQKAHDATVDQLSKMTRPLGAVASRIVNKYTKRPLIKAVSLYTI